MQCEILRNIYRSVDFIRVHIPSGCVSTIIYVHMVTMPTIAVQSQLQTNLIPLQI